MTLDDFKDWLFDLLNELEGDDILADIDANEKKNRFFLTMIDGKTFEIECREAKRDGDCLPKG